jgi:hypothetical protein
MRRSLLRCVAGITIAGVATLVSAAPASAARPRLQACVGATFSVGAHVGPDTVGSVVRDFARDKVASPPGLGDGIQLMQSGGLPDGVAANACND